MGALDGIRVIDFGQYIAGPLAAVMLADQGADVIHVDPPAGPAWKTDADAFFQRGKRRISLDLKSDDGSRHRAATDRQRRYRDRKLPTRASWTDSDSAPARHDRSATHA